MNSIRIPTDLKTNNVIHRYFQEWCAATELSSLPADPQTVADYLADQAVPLLGTILTEMTAAVISAAHVAEDLPDPVHSPEVTHAIRCLTQENKRPGATASNPISLRGLNLIEQQGSTPRNVSNRKLETGPAAHQRALEDRAMIRILRETAASANELQALRWQDIEHRPQGSGTETTVTLNHPEFGRGYTQTLAPETGLILRQLAATEAGTRETILGMEHRKLDRRIKRACSQAGMGDRYTVHSAHSGMLLDLMVCGIRSARVPSEDQDEEDSPQDTTAEADRWRSDLARFNSLLTLHPGERAALLHTARTGIA